MTVIKYIVDHGLVFGIIAVVLGAVIMAVLLILCVINI